MKLHYAFLSATLLLAACGGSGDSDIGSGGGGGGTNPTPDDTSIDPTDLPVPGDQACSGFTCSGNLMDIAYDTNDTDADVTDDILTLTGLPFDDDPLGAVFTYFADQNGFAVFQNNEPGTFNQYLAVTRDSAGSEITVGVVAIEGYQEYGYSGGWYKLNDLTSTIRDSGLVEYTGSYAGTMTYIGSGDLDLTDGTLTMQVDFTDSKLKGLITDRQINDAIDLPNLVLNDTNIDDGSFSGTVNSYDGQDVLETGTYQGFFGGTDSGVIGGLVQAFNPEFAGEGTDDDMTDDLSSRDLGVFVGAESP